MEDGCEVAGGAKGYFEGDNNGEVPAVGEDRDDGAGSGTDGVLGGDDGLEVCGGVFGGVAGGGGGVIDRELGEGGSVDPDVGF